MSKAKYRTKSKISSEICCKEGWAENYRTKKRRYSNTDTNWLDDYGKKSKAEINADLLRYSREGNKKMVRIALGNAADINVRGVDGNTSLILAVDSGCKELITYICEIGREDGLDFDAINNYGKSALHKAVSHLNFKAVKNIVASGGYIEIKDLYDQSPIFEVARKAEIKDAEVEMLELLHSLGADINSRNRENKTPLMDCCHSKERYRGVTKLIELAIEDNRLDEVVNSQDEKGNTPLLHAINAGNSPACDFLLKHYADLNQPNYMGVTPLMLSAKKGYKQALRALLATNKIDVLAKDRNGKTALNYAEACNNPDSINILRKATKYTLKHYEIQEAINVAKQINDLNELNKLYKEDKIYGDLSFFGKQNRVEFSFAK